MRMRLLVLGTVFAAGCGKDVTKDLEELADRACACADKKDATCGKAVADDLAKLIDASKGAKGDEPRSAAASRKLGECLNAIDPTLLPGALKSLSKSK